MSDKRPPPAGLALTSALLLASAVWFAWRRDWPAVLLVFGLLAWFGTDGDRRP